MESEYSIDPENNVFVGVGATEVMFSATQGILNPGDEVIVIEPAFDIYGAQVLVSFLSLKDEGVKSYNLQKGQNGRCFNRLCPSSI